ncbi:uroporphyrinogen-III C-methyltransferase [Shewanella maritima]|uniref:uroporphyrinogen-III C-methyltransferase n=1 Tax=Shewanella maritima TaxID=2520507 RepID=A0A411PCZ0_9GAMM|nr:uroporphyrinogen-III C-methyltransferase [Shewanella maritima]QBF81391.1 uroporphyrinogen-III C-methyltransferase [Shewanella maritima]
MTHLTKLNTSRLSGIEDRFCSSQLSSGEVAIVGAGCGELELLTLKAANRVQNADALVYDSLVSAEILTLATPECERHFVGKRCGQSSAKQDDINALLLKLALKGKKVVRLKGGDPHIFGRGAEEAIYLAKHGVKSEFIPGVTAALGCASSTSIPLTYRGHARSVTLITGTRMSEPGFEQAAKQWRALLDAESTLVFYMGKEQAQAISHGLLSANCKADLPVALVTNGGRRDQIITYASVKDMASKAKTITHHGPTLIVVGEVVNVGRALNKMLGTLETQALETQALKLA